MQWQDDPAADRGANSRLQSLLEIALVFVRLYRVAVLNVNPKLPSA
jgi:hypothetical protein